MKFSKVFRAYKSCAAIISFAISYCASSKVLNFVGLFKALWIALYCYPNSSFAAIHRAGIAFLRKQLRLASRTNGMKFSS